MEPRKVPEFIPPAAGAPRGKNGGWALQHIPDKSSQPFWSKFWGWINFSDFFLAIFAIRE